MRIKIKKSEFTPIRSLLEIAVHEYETYEDQYIKIMVHDAKFMIQDSSYRFRADSRVYRYSSYLSKNNIDLISEMDPEDLGIDEYRILLAIFEAL